MTSSPNCVVKTQPLWQALGLEHPEDLPEALESFNRMLSTTYSVNFTYPSGGLWDVECKPQSRRKREKKCLND